jgi:hypothetical protein
MPPEVGGKSVKNRTTYAAVLHLTMDTKKFTTSCPKDGLVFVVNFFTLVRFGWCGMVKEKLLQLELVPKPGQFWTSSWKNRSRARFFH